MAASEIVYYPLCPFLHLAAQSVDAALLDHVVEATQSRAMRWKEPGSLLLLHSTCPQTPTQTSKRERNKHLSRLSYCYFGFSRTRT